jgi:2-dehydropantoate 2-reductase
MRILMVGAGATGGFFGGKLVEAGRDVTFLLRERRAEQIRERGLEIIAPGGDLTIHPKVVTAEQLRKEQESYDLIVLSTKAYQFQTAMEDVAPAVGRETLLLPILNGMRQLSMMDERFGAEHVLGGCARIYSEMDERGRIHQFSGPSQINYGELSGDRSERILSVDRAIRDAGFQAILEADILATLWQKWWFLASLSATCVLARGVVGDIAGVVAYGAAFARAVVEECAGITKANGYPIEEPVFLQHIDTMTQVGSTLSSSMYRDLMKGAPVEADHILGDLLDRANGLPAPLVTAAYVQLKVYEASRASYS